MSTNITTIRSRLEALLGAVLSGYALLPNAYELATAPNIYLAKGYGIMLGAAVNSKRQVGCQVSIRREISIVLTKEVGATSTDDATREASEVTLLEDQWLMINALEQETPLTGTTGITTYVSDNGIELLTSAEEGRFLMVVTKFTCEYFENLT